MTKKYNYSVLILFILLFTTILPQESDLKKFGRYGESILKSATRFDSQDILNYGIVAGSTALAYSLDQKVNKFFRHSMPPLPEPVTFFNKYSVVGVFSLAGGLYLHGKLFDNQKNCDLGLKLGSALIYSTAVTTILKLVTGRDRPTISESNSNFNFFQTAWDNTSFPSGHATAGFAFASVMALSTENDIEKAAYWAVAGVMALERVYNSHHWLSDVVLGSAIGYFTGSLTGTSKEAPGILSVPMINITYKF